MKSLRVGMRLAALFLGILAVSAAVDAPPSAGRPKPEQRQKTKTSFGASWCGWCKKLDNFNQTPEVSAVLQKSFVIALSPWRSRATKPSLIVPTLKNSWAS
jgi:hypothetical protein